MSEEAESLESQDKDVESLASQDQDTVEENGHYIVSEAEADEDLPASALGDAPGPLPASDKAEEKNTLDVEDAKRGLEYEEATQVLKEAAALKPPTPADGISPGFFLGFHRYPKADAHAYIFSSPVLVRCLPHP